MKTKHLLFILLLGSAFNACIGAGTHGAIKGYKYFTSKYELEKAVHKVINESLVVKQDSARDYYNDDTNYITININEKGLLYSYTFRFYGDKEYWDTSTSSEVFIAYAYDEKGKGGSEGNGGFRWYNNKLKKKLTAAFEREVVDKIDKVLGIYHFEE
jgi:hypothetical protein